MQKSIIRHYVTKLWNYRSDSEKKKVCRKWRLIAWRDLSLLEGRKTRDEETSFYNRRKCHVRENTKRTGRSVLSGWRSLRSFFLKFRRGLDSLAGLSRGMWPKVEITGARKCRRKCCVKSLDFPPLSINHHLYVIIISPW